MNEWSGARLHYQLERQRQRQIIYQAQIIRRVAVGEEVLINGFWLMHEDRCWDYYAKDDDEWYEEDGTFKPAHPERNWNSNYC